MAQISISAIMARKNKLRIFTIAVCLLLAAFLGQMMITKNPKGSKAASACKGNVCTIDETGFITQIGGVSRFYAGSFGGVNAARFAVTNQTSLTITGNVTVELYIPLTLNSLTVRDGANLTHAAIAVADVDITKARTADDYLRVSGKLKKVDINISGSLKLENGAKIDVSEKGFPGGDVRGAWGYGPGAGAPGDQVGQGASGGGGGSNGGNDGHGKGGAGCNSFNNDGTSACTGATADSLTFDVDVNNPTAYGSGGGYAHEDWDSRNDTGKKGGGVIAIVADKIFLDTNSSILANGQNAGTAEFRAYGGPGSGGSVQITASNLYTRKLFSNTGPDILAGIVSENKGTADGESGTVIANIDIATIKNNIAANGGPGYRHSGGGGGGRIKIDLTSAKQICRIVSGDVNYIPVECNIGNPEYDESNGDVVINNTTVNADTIKVWQTTQGANIAGDQCNDGTNANNSGDSNCDSKRHFKSLTLINSGKLTHSAVTVAEATANIRGTLTVTDDLTGTGRWKKVELVVDTDMTLDLSSKIDVSAKGYPGGRLGSCPSKNYPVVNTENGYGPAGGRRRVGGSGSNAGGGAYIGVGGPGATGVTTTYNNPPLFELGSGGGAAYGHEYGGDAPFGSGEDYGCKDGGNGGGRVRLTVLGTFRIADINSKVLANGENEKNSTFGAGDHPTYAGGGGGAAGTIQINATNFNFIFMPTVTVLYKGGITGGGDGLYTPRSLAIPINLEAVGGNGGGGGGGGRITAIKIIPLSPGIKKKLVAVDRGGSAVFNPYGLQKDDKIRIEIEAHNLNLGQTTTVEDEILSTQDPALAISRCIPGVINPPDFANPGSTQVYDNTTNPPKVRWQFDPSAETVMLSYECTVQ